ncbi:MAG: HAMP domain-containing protein [Asticcacaulis sp.]
MLDFGWAFSLLAVVTAILVAHRIIAAIDAFDRNIRSLSDDDLHAHIAEAGRGDEIGQIARAVEAFRNRIIEKIADAQSDIKANARKSGMRSRYKWPAITYTPAPRGFPIA